LRDGAGADRAMRIGQPRQIVRACCAQQRVATRAGTQQALLRQQGSPKFQGCIP
jgi:hypothetical protein